MDHAEVRARLEEAYLEPAAADRLEPEIEAHLAECAGCAAEHAALRATAAALQLAIGPPAAARRRVLDNVAQHGRDRGRVQTVPRPLRRSAALPRLLAAAAVLATLAFVAGALSGALLGSRPGDEARLARATTMMAELARDPSARTLTLRDPAGAAGGTAIFEPSSRRLVVFSASLGAADADYDCFLERDSQRTWIGPMHYAAETYFWAGSVEQSAPDLGRAGDRLIVLVDAADPSALLAADL